MASPLAFIANAYLTLSSPGQPAVSGGRILSTPGQLRAIRLYLVRQDSAGITTGWEYAPRRSDKGSVMSGAGGAVTLHRGYALWWSNHVDGQPFPEAGTTLSSAALPSFLYAGQEGELYHGTRQPAHCYIESVHGKYGGGGIDEIVSREIGGIPIQLRVGELIN